MRIFISLLFVLFLSTSCVSDGGENASATHNNDGKGAIRLARSALEAGDADSAENILKQAIFQDKTKTENYYELADLYLRRKKEREAINLLEDGAKANPKDVAMIRKLSNTYLAAGQVEKALVVIDSALASNKDDIKLLSSKAVALDMQGKKKESRELYAKVIAKSGKDSSINAQNNLAMSHLTSMEVKKAIEILEKIATDSKASPQIRQNLALAYVLEQSFDKAKRVLLKDFSESEAIQNIEYYKAIAEQIKGGVKGQANSFTLMEEDFIPKQASSNSAITVQETKEPIVAPVALKKTEEIKQITPQAQPISPEIAKAEEEIEKPKLTHKKWFIDAGSYENEQKAKDKLAEISKAIPQMAAIASSINLADSKHRLVFGGFNHFGEFGTLCQEMIKKSFTCNIIQQTTSENK